jgi:hypothetical protein
MPAYVSKRKRYIGVLFRARETTLKAIEALYSTAERGTRFVSVKCQAEKSSSIPSTRSHRVSICACVCNHMTGWKRIGFLVGQCGVDFEILRRQGELPPMIHRETVHAGQWGCAPGVKKAEHKKATAWSEFE